MFGEEEEEEERKRNRPPRESRDDDDAQKAKRRGASKASWILIDSPLYSTTFGFLLDHSRFRVLKGKSFLTTL